MTGTALYDPSMIICYPVWYSFFPILFVGVMDQSVRDSTANDYPQCYYVGQQGRLLNLKQMLEAFLQHRKEVVTRRTLFLLRRARRRGHLLEGQAVALANIEAVIDLIRSSPSAVEAREALRIFMSSKCLMNWGCGP